MHLILKLSGNQILWNECQIVNVIGHRTAPAERELVGGRPEVLIVRLHETYVF